MKAITKSCRMASVLVVVAGLASSVGCQVEIGGQTLPSGYYLTDDVQYYPPGQPFKLDREAAALRAAAAETSGSAQQQP
jgi:hypothetical protein